MLSSMSLRGVRGAPLVPNNNTAPDYLMKSLFYAVLLLFATSIAPFTMHGAPPLERPGSGLVLQDGTRAIIKNDKLMLLAPDGKESPAPAGHYVTRNGPPLTVGTDGRVSINNSRTPAGAAADVRAGAPSGAPENPSSASHNPAPSLPTAVARPLAESQPPANMQSRYPRDVADSQKLVDPILSSLAEITTTLKTIEAKQVALENEIKALPTTTGKDLDQFMKHTSLFLEAINMKLPNEGWNPHRWGIIYDAAVRTVATVAPVNPEP